MRQVIDFYRMAKKVEELGKLINVETKTASYGARELVTTAVLLSKFTEDYKPKYSERDAKRIRNNAIGKYLGETKYRDGNVFVHATYLKAEGDDLIGKV